jgi:hypothetical protein
MIRLSVAPSSVETPMERIFEKVMQRKMTKAEKEVLQLNGPAKTSKKHSSNRAVVSHKNAFRFLEKKRRKNAAKLTLI